MKKLKRKYAYVCLSLLICGMIFFWSPFLFQMSADPAKFFIGAGTILLLCALGVKFILLKCPKCGYSGLIPQLVENETYCCPKCGNKIKWE